MICTDISRRRRLLGGALGVLSWAGPPGWVARAASDPTTPAYEWRDWPAQRRTPNLRLPLLDGSSWTLGSQRGRAVLLNFWASWCEPCREELPALAQLAKSLAPQGLLVVGVNYQDSRPTIERFMARDSTTLPVLLDSDGAAAKAFTSRIFPTTVLVGRDGRALGSFVGDPGWTGADAQARVSRLLAGSPR